MKESRAAVFSVEELEFLRTQADDYGWYVWTEETRPIIEGLCARRLMAANGDFKVVPKDGQHRANLEGHAPRAADAMLRYYELIGAGRMAFHMVQHPRPAMTGAPLTELRGSHALHG
ncbi:hypothetical protein ACETRX_00510 [Labrys portucalensis]|uniref:Uncharacterized protein n=1 Tax=Labrys neptuniae TaxID=376174 RepID=A0ABV6Z7K5_9HYPH|nr:hypothetical protein [Labrys neptuniae]MDT3380791.1 hypothetical protein [Labrys neptuniae]